MDGSISIGNTAFGDSAACLGEERLELKNTYG